jgi:hypothetical protein
MSGASFMPEQGQRLGLQLRQLVDQGIDQGAEISLAAPFLYQLRNAGLTVMHGAELLADETIKMRLTLLP